MQTGENEQSMRKILDMTRFIAIGILLLHCYYYCYAAFKLWGLSSSFSERILSNIVGTGLFQSFHRSKFFALGFLVISLFGIRGKKKDKLRFRPAVLLLAFGLALYFSAYFILLVSMDTTIRALLYMGVVALSFLLLISGGALLSRIIHDRLSDDIFNLDQQSFPQQELLLENEFSVNLSTRYHYKGKLRQGYINIIAPFRASIVLGNPGSGKSAYCIRQFIVQAFAKQKPFTMLVYDFKFPDLSLIAYNHWLRNKARFSGDPQCIFINFDDLSRTHRGNVFDPLGMVDITDAVESARTILLGLNREWQKKQGDFFVESPINFVTAIIWFLRKYQNGIYCTLPHVIELIQIEYDDLFSVLRSQTEIEVLVNPFINAYLNGVMEQLEGQIASAKIALARLASPALYYVLSGEDFTLDINNPASPKLICMGNNPQKIQTYGAVLSLYINRLLKIINQKNKLKSMLIFDEFPTLIADIIPTIATGRSNQIAVCLGIQDVSQLRKDYGREQAEVIMNTVGNIIAGQVTGDTAKQLSERIGKIMQDRESLSINRSDTSISKSKQLEAAVPPSTIASLSSGEFVGMVADTPNQRIDLKAFHCQIENDFDAVNLEERNYHPIPIVRLVESSTVNRNYLQIKSDIKELIHSEIARMRADPALKHLVLQKS